MPEYAPDAVTDYFFTNAILCLKDGGMQGPAQRDWFNNCGKLFLKPLIDLVHPRILVSLGEEAYRGILTA